MIKEKEVEYTITNFPKDFWNYAVNPISGYIIDRGTSKLKTPPTIEKDKRQRRRAINSSTNREGDTLTK